MSSNANAYSWDFGDGSPADTTANPSHNYAAVGVYSVAMTVTDHGRSRKDPKRLCDRRLPRPVICQYVDHRRLGTWTGAGFTGTLRYLRQGQNGNGSSNAPNPAKNIVAQQGVQGGQLYDPTKQGNQPYRCDYNVTVVYAP